MINDKIMTHAMIVLICLGCYSNLTFEFTHAFLPQTRTRSHAPKACSTNNIKTCPLRINSRITHDMIPTSNIARVETDQAALAALVAKKLYPASMIGTLGEAYFRTRKEMGCPRGVAVGYMAQIATILLSIPMISIVKSSSPEIHSILQVDWLHFIESVLFWISIHIQAISFRKAVESVEDGKKLPASALQYRPKVMEVLILFGLTLVIAMGHYIVNPTSWQHTQLFGGWFNPPTPGHTPQPGELSFPTWIFHWSMIFDYIMQLRCMWRWGDFTGNEKWKLYTLLHLPACMVNGIVMLNHLHRDQIVALRLMHPVLVFIGSIVTFYGSYVIARGNGWSIAGEGVDRLNNVSLDSKDNHPKLLKGSNSAFTLASFAAGSLLAYCSLYLTV